MKTKLESVKWYLKRVKNGKKELKKLVMLNKKIKDLNERFDEIKKRKRRTK